MNDINANKRLIAAAQLVLILPAALFLTAVVARHVQLPQYADIAQQIVTWYSARYWTLWVLLIGLPFAALLMGWVTLMRSSSGTRMIAVETIAAGLILAVVVLHMLAN